MLHRAMIIATLAASFAFAVPATAGPLEDGAAAYARGDYAGARNLIQPLADRGDPPAEAMLGLMYVLGHGVKQNYAAALSWYRKAADQGLASAQSDLGSMYDN